MTQNLEPAPNHISNRRPRVFGLVSIGIGLLFAKWQIYDPLHAAARGKQNVWILVWFVAIGVYLPAWGLLFLAFGSRPNSWFKIDPNNLNWRNVLFLLAFGSIGLAMLFFVIHSLELQGYVVRTGW